MFKKNETIRAKISSNKSIATMINEICSDSKTPYIFMFSYLYQ